jgi:serralysin
METDTSSRLRVLATFVATCVMASLVALSGVAIAAAGGPASVTISDVTVTEGTLGSAVVVTFTLKVAKRAHGSLGYATENGTAKQPGDYLAKSGVVKFNGKGSRKVAITVQSDAVNEFDETFFLRLSNPRNVIIADGEGMATILDDDPLPVLSASDVVVPEGNAGETTLASVDVTLNGLTEKTVHVDYATAGGSAATPGDYSTASGTLTFAPGQTLQSVQMAVTGDDAVEGDETFVLNLSGADQATIGQGHATVTIQDNDVPNPVTVSIGDQSIQEGDKGNKTLTFTVTLSQQAEVSVDYQIVNGSALAPADYVTGAGHFDFTAGGPISQPVSVSIVGDRSLEHLEDFFVNLVDASGAQVVDGQATGEIRDNDTRTNLTKVWKGSGRIHVSGLLAPAHPGKRMTVKLYRYRNGKWVWLRTRRPSLKGSSDVDLDGFHDSSFSTSYLRPSPGSCKVVAIFPGDSDHRSSKKSKKINC